MVTPFTPLVTLGAETLAPEQIGSPLEILTGRADPTAQPDANGCQLTVYGELPASARVGMPAVVARSMRGAGPWGPAYSGGQSWDDLWSEQTPNDPALLPGAAFASQADYDAWARFWGWDATTVGSWSPGAGHTAFTGAGNLAVVWQGPAVELNSTYRTLVVQALVTGEPSGTANWEILWSITNPNPDYFGANVDQITSPPVTLGPAGVWCYLSAELPSEARYVRIGIRHAVTAAAEVVMAGVAAALTPGVVTDSPRVVGTITDVTSARIGDRLETDLTITGHLASLGSDHIGDSPWPIETDKARADRIGGLSRTLIVAAGTESLNVRERDVDRQTVLDVLHGQAASTGAILWERGDGTPMYSGPETRGLDTFPVTLTATQILTPPEWSQSIGRLTTGVVVHYGPEDARGTVTLGAGPAWATIETELADQASAEGFGAMVLRRWGDREFWDAPVIETDSRIMSAATYDLVLALQPGDRLATDGLGPTPSTSGGKGDWIVEGVAETWTDDGAGLVHSFALAVSDFRRFSVAGEPTVATLNLDRSAITFGDPYTAFVAIKNAGSVPVTVGTVNLLDESGRVVRGPVQIGSSNQVIPMTGTELMPGARTLTAHYEGVFATWADSVSDTEPLAVTQPTGTAVGCTVSPNPCNNGDNVTLSASVSSQGGTPTGTIVWQYAAPGAAWADWLSDNLVNGKASRLWQSNTPGDWQWRAKYVPAAGTPWAAGTSASVGLRVRQLVTQVLEYVATWSAVYKGTGRNGRTPIAPIKAITQAPTETNARSWAATA